MTVTHMEILGREGEVHPKLGLTRHTRDALAEYCKLRWPHGRRKAVVNEWGLSNDEARAVCEATASATTIDRIWKHPKGGWAVLVPVLGAVIGQSFDGWLNQEQGRLARARRDFEAQERRLVALADRTRTLFAVADPDAPGVGDGQSRAGAGEVGRSARRADRPTD